MALTLYKKKRNFKNTPEPKGKTEKSSQLHFVVQRHDASHLHYDFRLELQGVLKSWAVPKGPSMKAGERRLAVMVEDHPISYGSFTGEIPKGNYGAGIVQLWDKGTYQPLEEVDGKDAEKHFLSQLKKGDLKFELKGKHLKGAFALVQMKSENDDRNWLLIKKKDEKALPEYAIETIKPVKPYSKKASANKASTGKQKSSHEKTAASTKVAVAKPVKNPTGEKISEAWNFLKAPMLASLGSIIATAKEWFFEMKYDGYRAMTLVNNGKIDMRSRNDKNFTEVYGPLVREMEKITDDVILDGEIVIENENGVSDFQRLQNYTRTKEGELKYYVFDILFLNGHRLVELPLHQRKELLNEFFKKYSFQNIHNSGYEEKSGKVFAARLKKKGYEGIIAKKKDGLYHPSRRTDTWVKIKNVLEQETIICGYTAPQNSRQYFGSLVLGMYNNGILTYVGNCGSGFTDVSLKELHEKFEKIKSNKCPFPEVPIIRGSKGKVSWVKPVLVCNVKFQEWTNDGHMRIPIFQGIRIDKKPAEVKREKTAAVKKSTKDSSRVEKKNSDISNKKRVPVQSKAASAKALSNAGPVITNADKIYFPKDKITKGDVINYYKRISKFILPYLKDRPQSLLRHPNGIDGMNFYQKDMDTKTLPSYVETSKVFSNSTDKYIDYLICNSEDVLVYMANLGCIEINPWHSKLKALDNPDYLIMDLDPAGKITFQEVVDTALVIKDICDELDIKCFCKTSGATGIHIYIPLKANYSYDEIKMFAELLAHMTHKRLPGITSIERSTAKRKNKIYIDFLQNRKGQTVASVYSVRPKPGATVSTPLKWSEVNHKLDPSKFTIHTMEARLKKMGDLWKNVLGPGINLLAVLKKIDVIKDASV